MNGLPVPTQIFVYVLQSPCFVRCDDRSLMSILLKPGTRPGKRKACSSAVFKINFTTCSTVSAEEVLLGSRFLFQCTCKLNHFYDVSPGCRSDFCGGSVEREMFSCRVFGRDSNIPFLYTVDFFLFCQKCWFCDSSQHWIAPNITRSSSVDESSLQLFLRSTKSSILSVVLQGFSSAANLHWHVSS